MSDEPYKIISDEMKADLEASGVKVYRDVKNVKIDTRWYDDPKLVHYIGMQKPRRPGVLLFFTMLEHVYFPPDTAKNSQFTLAYFEWSHGLWVVSSIPIKYKLHGKAIAKKCGIRIADGVPTEPTLDSLERIVLNYFPINRSNAFALENESGHPVYKNSGFCEKWFPIEDQIIDIILHGGDMELVERLMRDMI